MPCGVTARFFETLKAGLALLDTTKQRLLSRVPLVSDQNKLVVESNLRMGTPVGVFLNNTGLCTLLVMRVLTEMHSQRAFMCSHFYIFYI